LPGSDSGLSFAVALPDGSILTGNGAAASPDGSIQTFFGTIQHFDANGFSMRGSTCPQRPGGGGGRAPEREDPDRRANRRAGPGIPAANYRLERLMPDLSLDPTFGTNGTLTVDVSGAGTESRGAAFATAPNGSIVIVSRTTSGGVVAARYTANGKLDLSFGNNGRATPAALQISLWITGLRCSPASLSMHRGASRSRRWTPSITATSRA